MVKGGYNIIILSDRCLDANHVAIPALLATAGVHHHLIRTGLRTSAGLVVETGEPRRVHDFCLLAGYGAEAINPYLAFDTIVELADELPEDVSVEEAQKRYIKAVDKGMLKVFSKMGISTFQSYCGAQIFDAVGLNGDFIERFFTKTASKVGGIGLKEVAEETVRRHGAAFGTTRSTPRSWTWAASWRGATAAKRTPGRRKPFPCCSTPCARVTATRTASTKRS